MANEGVQRLILLSRSYCSLCDEMEAALRPLIGATPLEVVDVDAERHARLEARFGYQVPVLFADECEPAREVCRYRLDLPRLRSALAGALEVR